MLLNQRKWLFYCYRGNKRNGLYYKNIIIIDEALILADLVFPLITIKTIRIFLQAQRVIFLLICQDGQTAANPGWGGHLATLLKCYTQNPSANWKLFFANEMILLAQWRWTLSCQHRLQIIAPQVYTHLLNVALLNHWPVFTE